jgi:hypothetical protein
LDPLATKALEKKPAGLSGGRLQHHKITLENLHREKFKLFFFMGFYAGTAFIPRVMGIHFCSNF